MGIPIPISMEMQGQKQFLIYFMQLVKTPKAKIVKGREPNTKDEIQKTSHSLCAPFMGSMWVKSCELGGGQLDLKCSAASQRCSSKGSWQVLFAAYK